MTASRLFWAIVMTTNIAGLLFFGLYCSGGLKAAVSVNTDAYAETAHIGYWPSYADYQVRRLSVKGMPAGAATCSGGVYRLESAGDTTIFNVPQGITAFTCFIRPAGGIE